MLKISNAIDVAIEVTRRCNMKCAHCLRGDAQNMDVSKETIDKFFDGFAGGAYISTIVLTGGEISLNVPAVRYVLKALKSRGISVGNFYMVTNGKSLRELKTLIRASLDWYLFCDDNEYSIITMSQDMFHEPLPNLYEVKKTSALCPISEMIRTWKVQTEKSIYSTKAGQGILLQAVESKRHLSIFLPLRSL